ncbi:hypothetical protein L1987_22265 [Smallanthus sonchifolius]|uniref:Uncharacterized protein n=1 Tax=Smallanthus sonchifolius TaxID=185202 RepID=A0ACB9IDP0_9ASTR|nr:hypothetical protein L1987_22265 [Smallanthus sonchifolius]
MFKLSHARWLTVENGYSGHMDYLSMLITLKPSTAVIVGQPSNCSVITLIFCIRNLPTKSVVVKGSGDSHHGRHIQQRRQHWFNMMERWLDEEGASRSRFSSFLDDPLFSCVECDFAFLVVVDLQKQVNLDGENEDFGV